MHKYGPNSVHDRVILLPIYSWNMWLLNYIYSDKVNNFDMKIR